MKTLQTLQNIFKRHNTSVVIVKNCSIYEEFSSHEALQKTLIKTMTQYEPIDLDQCYFTPMWFQTC